MPRPNVLPHDPRPSPGTLTSQYRHSGSPHPDTRGWGQTAMPRGLPDGLATHGELPEHIDYDHTASQSHLLAWLIQGEGLRASGTPADTHSDRAACMVGCLAWPCQLIVARAAGTEIRSRTRGRVCVVKEADPLGLPIKAVACMKTLAPRDLKDSHHG
jgi:hypothetical protein